METIWQDLTRGMGGGEELTRVIFRLLAALFAGGMVGYQREWERKFAGLRTHILVTVGACLLVLAGGAFGMSSDGVSRVVQGIVTGIGFLGAGTILKLSQEHSIRGLTTSAGIWVTSAIGIAIGLGLVGIALIATVLTVIVLALIKPVEAGLPKTRLIETGQEDGER
ncbi:MAG: MgtC/SapB family protein [Acidobacteriota bacterium]